MLKKAGIVVLGATAGVMSLSGVAFAGTSDSGSSHDGGHDKDSSHHEDHGKDRDGGRCGDDVAFSGSNKLVDASNLAANSDLDVLNILSSTGGDDDCQGGDDLAFSGDNKLVDASNLLANSDVDLLNVLSSTG